jgi:hypothetical protein
MTTVSHAEARRRIGELFPCPAGHLMFKLAFFAMHGQAFDVTFPHREPLLEVTLAPAFARRITRTMERPFSDPRLYSLMGNLLFEHPQNWGLADRLIKLCRQVELTDGTILDLTEVWILNYMPRDLDISDVDLSEGEQRIGDNGETMREMISQSYRCRSRAEEDYFLARFIAS